MHVRRDLADGAALAAAVLAVAVTYGILAVHPWSHVPLNEFLATFGRANAAAWPAQTVWYLAAVAMVGLAFWPTGRSSQRLQASWPRRTSRGSGSLGGVFIAYALIGYPVIGLLGGHPLRDLPVFG